MKGFYPQMTQINANQITTPIGAHRRDLWIDSWADPAGAAGLLANGVDAGLRRHDEVGWPVPPSRFQPLNRISHGLMRYRGPRLIKFFLLLFCSQKRSFSFFSRDFSHE